jgi:hypothetical protein
LVQATTILQTPYRQTVVGKPGIITGNGGRQGALRGIKIPERAFKKPFFMLKYKNEVFK